MTTWTKPGPIVMGTYDLVAGGVTLINGTSSPVGTDSKIGGSNPGWKDKVVKHIDASSAYSRQKYILDQEGHFYASSRARFGADRRLWEADGFSLQLPDLSVPSTVEISVKDIALKKLKRRIAKDVGDFNVLVPIGELKDLRSTLASSFNEVKGLLGALNSLKHGKRPRGDLLKYAADVWLNFSFGINPMIADARDLLSSIDKYNNRRNHIKHFKGSHSYNWSSSIPVVQFQPVNGVHLQKVAGAQLRLSYKYTAAVNLQLKTANNYGLADHLHFSPGEIIPVLWELLPWSWLFDYISTAGDYFSDMYESSPGETIYVVENRRLYVELQESIMFNGFNEKLYSDLQFRSKPLLMKRFIFNRNPLAQIPHRAYRFKTIDEIFGDPYLVKKMLNLASIAALRS